MRSGQAGDGGGCGGGDDIVAVWPSYGRESEPLLPLCLCVLGLR